MPFLVITGVVGENITKYQGPTDMGSALAIVARLQGTRWADAFIRETPATGTIATWRLVNDALVDIGPLLLSGEHKIAVINAEANKRLAVAYPASEQIWDALRASQLIHKRAVQGQNLTAPELATLVAINTAMTFVDAIRTARLALIAGPDLTHADIVTNAAWPVQP